MKRLAVITMVLLLSIVFTPINKINAKEVGDGDSQPNYETLPPSETIILDGPPLSKEERVRLLTEVGLSESDLELMSKTTLRSLLETNSILVAEFNQEFGISDDELVALDQIGDLDPATVSLGGRAFYQGIETSGTYKGKRKYLVSSMFHWKKMPVNAFTDGFAIGWSGSAFATVPISNNKIEKFKGTHSLKDYRLGWLIHSQTYTPYKYSPAGGVGWRIDIKSAVGEQKGEIDQTIYVDNNSSGTLNFQAEYGHAQLRTAPSFSVSSTGFGFGITPSIGIKTGSIPFQITW